MESDTPEATALQLITDAVVAHLDTNPDVVQQAIALDAQATAQVQTQLQTPAQPTTTTATAQAVDAVLLQDLTNHVLAQLGTNQLTQIQGDELTRMATKYSGQGLQAALADRAFPFTLTSWRNLAGRRAARANRAAGPSLAAQAGVNAHSLPQGEVVMGDTDVASIGSERKILWTTGIGGCVGVVIVNAGKCYLAHYKPDQLKPTVPTGQNQSPLDNEMYSIGERIELNGASVTLSSPSSAGAPYYQAFRQRLIQAGATIVAQYTTDTLAVRTADGQVFHGFPPP